MALIHQKSDTRNDHHYYSTDRVVTVQIGQSTNKGRYVWTVFHPDIKCAIWGDESSSIDFAIKEADEWIAQWVVGKTPSG